MEKLIQDFRNGLTEKKDVMGYSDASIEFAVQVLINNLNIKLNDDKIILNASI